jgi:multiple sugar transport system permease protein
MPSGDLTRPARGASRSLRSELLGREPISKPTSFLQVSRAWSGRLLGTSHTARYQAALRLMLLPFLLGALALVALPAASMFLLIFVAYDGLSPPRWSGAQNFVYVVTDPLFWIAARNTIVFVALAVPLRILGALALALLLRRRRRGTGLYRLATYLPGVIPDAAYALIWLWIFNPLYGPLNLLLGAIGLPTPAWLVDPRLALLAIVVMSLFQIGEGIVVFLAALQDIPHDYYQAAAIDGGSRWQMFRFITLPLLAPWLLLLTVRDIIMSAQNTFTPAYLMTGGGPYYATLFMPLLIYEEAFDRFRYGEAALMLLLLFVWLGLLLWLLFTLLGGWGYQDEA